MNIYEQDGVKRVSTVEVRKELGMTRSLEDHYFKQLDIKKSVKQISISLHDYNKLLSYKLNGRKQRGKKYA